MLARQTGIQYYRIKVDNVIRMDTWWDLKLNTANGKYEILEQFAPETVAGQPGFYKIRPPKRILHESTLGMILNSVSLANGLRSFTIELADAAGTIITALTQTLLIYIDNNKCVASIQMPTVAGIFATNPCGMLKFTNKTDPVQIVYVASHPKLFANYSFAIVKGSSGNVYSLSGTYTVSAIYLQLQRRHLAGCMPKCRLRRASLRSNLRHQWCFPPKPIRRVMHGCFRSHALN